MRSKNPVGLSENPTYSHGMIGQSAMPDEKVLECARFRGRAGLVSVSRVVVRREVRSGH